jgi:hypothetical protein
MWHQGGDVYQQLIACVHNLPKSSCSLLHAYQPPDATGPVCLSLVDSHERVIAELTEEYEDKLHSGQEAIHGVQRNLDFQNKEFEETKFQLEEDADREIEQVKGKYEDRLRLVRRLPMPQHTGVCPDLHPACALPHRWR